MSKVMIIKITIRKKKVLTFPFVLDMATNDWLIVHCVTFHIEMKSQLVALMKPS